MGLDVSAVTNWKQVDITEEFYQEEDHEYHRVYHNKHFPSHTEELSNVTYYEALDYDGDFHMSYGGYSSFRDFLAKLAGYYHQTPEPTDYSDPEYRNKHYDHMYPHVAGIYKDDSVTMESDFVALIHFSDCEGIISNKWCKLLDAAFDKYLPEVDKLPEDDYYKQKYYDMAECVKAAANSEKGFLYFH